MTHKRITIYTEIVGLENVGKVLCKTKSKWKNHRGNVQTWCRRGQ